ncbi:MAG: hypothetical protein ACREYD_04265 [Casimicrobiaceae bacterium]
MRRFLAILLALAALGGWHWWSSERPVQRPPGIVAPDEPVQVALDPPQTFDAKGYTFVKRARFDITARLLRKERYRVDAEAALAPYDLGVGWGPLSDSAILDQLEFTQMGRFFYWNPKRGDFPLPRQTTITHLAQIHVIPANADVAARLARLRPGQLVSAQGYLVDVRGPRGFSWNTSLRRDDTGDGACEILWAEVLATD